MKIYIRYMRPFKNKNDEPPIDEVWSHGERPKKNLADGLTYVYDVVLEDRIAKSAINERIWDGIE